jgi:hypothetical protein
MAQGCASTLQGRPAAHNSRGARPPRALPPAPARTSCAAQSPRPCCARLAGTAPPPRAAPCPRGLQAMLNQRRKLLSYLRRTDFEAFCYMIHRLGLRDNNYARQVGASRVAAPGRQPRRGPRSAPGRAAPLRDGAARSAPAKARPPPAPCKPATPPFVPLPPTPRCGSISTASARAWGRPQSLSSGTASGNDSSAAGPLLRRGSRLPRRCRAGALRLRRAQELSGRRGVRGWGWSL